VSAIEADKTVCEGIGMCEAQADNYFQIGDDGLVDVLISAVIVAPWRPGAAPTPRRPIHVHTRNGPRSPLIQRLQLLLLVPTPATRVAITTAAASPRRIAARPRILLFHPNMITTRSA
jgi:hypothetical protein